MNSEKPIALIGYSGHAYVVKEIFDSMGSKVVAYCEPVAVPHNPFQLQYLGPEADPAVLTLLHQHALFVAIGDNALREKVALRLLAEGLSLTNAIDRNALISPTAQLGQGVMLAPRSVVNAFAAIGEGAICNTGSIIEHECKIGAYAHIAPGAVLCGNVEVGALSLIGANAVVRPGIRIGKGAVVGAGAVITKDVADHQRVVGHAHRIL